MAKDLRSYLDQIRAYPGQLVEIDRAVRPHEFEVTALLKQIDDNRRYPAVLFQHPTDQYDQPSQFELLSNLYAARERCALALGIDPSTPNREVSVAYHQASRRLLDPELVGTDRAPVHEYVWQGADADVGRLPIVRHFAMDMGPVITMSHAMRSHEGFYDLSFAKTFYKWDPQQMVVSIHTRDLSRILKEYEDRDEPAPIINVVGHHPAFHLGVLARNQWGVNDYETIGSVMGEPLRLTPSVTWGDRFLVPADAELIIEGEIPPGQRELCDPFGEVAGLYQAQCLRPIFNVKAITFRRSAIMQDIFTGYRDGFVGFHAIIKEGALDELLRPRFPNLYEVHLPDSGNGMRAAYISVRDTNPEQVQEIARAAIDGVMVQLVIVVDNDVNVFNETEVLWAMHTYADPEEGITMHGGQADRRRGTPTWVPRSGFGTSNWEGHKMIVDATRPRNFAFGDRSTIPDEVLNRVRLADYAPTEARPVVR